MSISSSNSYEDCYYRDLDTYAKKLEKAVARPSSVITPFISKLLLSVGLSAIIILSVMRKVDVVAGISIVLLSVIFYLIFTNMASDNLAGSLPYATYPVPRNLGLDGVSKRNKSFGY